MVTLDLRYADDLGHETWVKKEGFPARDRVRANERMLGDDWFPANDAAKSNRSVGLHLCGVKRCETFEVLLHGSGECVVGGVLRAPESVSTATDWRSSEDLERSVGWGLDLIGNLNTC